MYTELDKTPWTRKVVVMLCLAGLMTSAVACGPDENKDPADQGMSQDMEPGGIDMPDEGTPDELAAVRRRARASRS